MTWILHVITIMLSAWATYQSFMKGVPGGRVVRRSSFYQQVFHCCGFES